MSTKTSVLDCFNYIIEHKDLNEGVNKLKDVVNLFFSGDTKLSIDLNRYLPNGFVNTEFIQDLTLFLKYLCNCSTKEEYDKLKDKFKLKEISQIDILFEAIISTINKKNLSSNELVDFSWQLALIEKQSHNSNLELSKYDKIDINFNFKLNSLVDEEMKNNNKITDNIMKFNYYEFQEVLEQFKNIETQIKAFKQ